MFSLKTAPVWLLFFLLAGKGAAQTRADDGPKGQLMIYGSLDYSKTSAPQNNSSSFSTSPNAGIPVGIGYFIDNNNLIGINMAFARNKDAAGQLAFQQQEVGFWYSPSKQIGEHFLLIAQVDAHYVWGRSPGVPSGDLTAYQGYRLRAYPMLGVLLGKGWALKFKFGELSMLTTKAKGQGAQHDFVAGLSGATFGTGISKNFSLRKRHD
ncbi:hypothetical protein [Siphonobacter aquaeclarae]|jgi:hypothetical protein|uniref:Outer membrane protein beta-barrel domain-containing protein n=1 Tax=Siphonobacter aquaeclarae TaxID=563176 RepID=A0A1G9Y2G2_9BACT|nr:hypothetical protein [Siphonobacter aquaeclarae]MBO9640882.1 hypothetical protein [Siphonobacter aquaeclarae]SDN03282.1 hypothetical protein SAMN04488090_4791 [Siphonobacter aquaeclarae]